MEDQATDEEGDPLMKPDKRAGKPTPAQIGIVIEEDPDPEDEILVRKKHKKHENKKRNEEMLEIDDNIRKLQKKMKKFEDDHIKKTKFRMEIMRLTEQVEDLREEEMNEDKFWGLMALNDDEAFDYGRDTLKDGIYEQRF